MSLPGVKPLKVTCSPIFQMALDIITSAAYEDQLRYCRDKDLNKKDYGKILSRSMAISKPKHLGNRILQFLYF